VRAALFDLDRTLVRKETATMYVRYMRRRGGATWGDSLRTLGWVAQYTLGVIDAPAVAARVLGTIAGMHETVLASRCEDWFRRDVERHVADAGRQAVRDHQERGHVVAIVTATTPYAARPLARLLGIEHVVASELELAPDGRFTGRFVEPFCYGAGKLARARDLAERLGFDLHDAAFYSDSHSDLPLLEAVGTPVVVNPDPRLARVARRRHWRVERW
jgi:HAD superfamily hydrolase (TIGR01490 family)